MQDPFEGTWKMTPDKSKFDPNHRPLQATLTFTREAGGYRMEAEGVKADGQKVKEQTQHLHVDGIERPIPGQEGVTGISTRSSPNTICAEGRMSGRVVGKATYAVSEDGKFLTATVAGIDAEHREFQTMVAWERA